MVDSDLWFTRRNISCLYLYPNQSTKTKLDEHKVTMALNMQMKTFAFPVN